MRIPLIRRIALQEGVDYASLPKLQAISTAFRNWYYNSRTVTRKRREKENKAHLQREQDIEDVKSVILYRLKDLKVGVLMRVEVPRICENYIYECLESKDFVKYSINIPRIDDDILLSFPETPVLLEVRLK